MACDNFQNYPLRKQITVLVFFGNGILLLAMLIFSIGIYVGTNNSIKSQAEQSLIDQTQRNIEKTMNGRSNLFSNILLVGKEGFTNFFAYATRDTYRPDYALGFTPSYFEYGDTFLAPPLTQDSRQSKPVSLSNSAYYLPGTEPADLPFISALTNETINRSAHTDSFWRVLYNLYKDFVAGYIGFETDGLFRHYPGTGTLDTDPTRSYDPRVRGWYTDSLSTPDQFIYTSPYLDFNGKGWMITLSQVIKDINNQIVGVAGADMLIQTIANNINQVKFLESGKITLFETNGVVVADKEWDLDPNDPTVLTYKDLQSPPVSDELWSRISNVDGSIVNIQEDEYTIVASRLQDFGNKYLFVAFVPNSEITDPANEVISDINKKNLIVSLSLTAAYIVVIVIILILVLYIANRITKPLDQTNENINRMMQNIGGEEIGEGLQDIERGVGFEQNEFRRNFNVLLQQIQQQRENDNANQIQNPFFIGLGQNQIIQDYGGQAFPEGATFASAPSAADLGIDLSK